MGATRPPRAPALALTVPGIGPVLASQAASLGLRPAGVGFDGRADVVRLDSATVDELRRLRTAETLLASAGSLRRRATPRATAAGINRATLEAGLDHLRRLGGRIDGPSFRVVLRVREERSFSRTALRGAVASRLGALLPRWRQADDSTAAELWVLQIGHSRYQLGFRLSALGSRSHPARRVERPGALRPAVAAAMVHLAGPPSGRLLDPCCGVGTLLGEARVAGWSPVGGDIDGGALAGAVANTGTPVALLDARRLPFADDALDAVVTNLPFGGKYQVQGLPVAWYRRVLAESVRVAPVAVVLAVASEPYRQALGRLPVDVRSRHDVVLLGQPTSIWTLARRTR